MSSNRVFEHNGIYNSKVLFLYLEGGGSKFGSNNQRYLYKTKS